MRYLYTLLLFLTLSANGVFAQNIVTDRPDQTESSATIHAGELQVESGLLLGYTTIDGVTRQEHLAPTTLFRYGLFEWAELRLVNQFEFFKFGDHVSQGIGDLQIGTKVQLYQQEGANTEVAFISHLVVPTGTSSVSSDGYGVINKLSISHPLSENVGLGYNLGYDNFGGNGDFTYSVALGVGVTDKVGIYIEPFGAYTDLETWESNFDAGFTYLVNPTLQLDFSFGTGLDNDFNYISAGVSWLARRD